LDMRYRLSLLSARPLLK